MKKGISVDETTDKRIKPIVVEIKKRRKDEEDRYKEQKDKSLIPEFGGRFTYGNLKVDYSWTKIKIVDPLFGGVASYILRLIDNEWRVLGGLCFHDKNTQYFQTKLDELPREVKNENIHN